MNNILIFDYAGLMIFNARSGGVAKFNNAVEMINVKASLLTCPFEITQTMH